MTRPKKLTTYRKKRDFSVTAEPKGKKSGKKPKELNFVVQMHAASHLHYDFRLEIEDVLKSWAIPKGPSLNPNEKRLAIETEDHPLEYRNFEGIIPQGQYGGGAVIIWDKGTYESMLKNSSLSQDYKKGHFVINLKGKKLKGEFALHRIKNDKKPQWLFIKLKDKYANENRDILKNNKSVVSGKTIQKMSSEKVHE